MHTEKRTRRKPIKSCLECNRRKQKCNRRKPCNHCIGRGVQHLCVYSVTQPQRGRSRSNYTREGRASSAAAHSERETSTTLSSYDSDLNETGLGAFDPLGYQSPEPSSLSPNAPQALHPPHPLRMTKRKHSSHSGSRPRKLWPEKSVTDFLVGMFLQEINQIYEATHPPSFQPRYASWWIAQENNDRSGDAIRDEDIDFGLLVLRVCLLSIQSLPHSKFPTTGVLKSHPEAMERWYSSLADELDKSQPPFKKPSMETVQHRFLHVSYLTNYGKIQESWSVLSTAVKDAHEMGLHLKEPGIAISELDMELRRRTFWNLYVWDRFMCTFFGHWPLIPEGYFDIEPPYDNLQALTLSPYVLTPFTDRVFHIKLALYLTAFMSLPSWKSDQRDPAVVSEFAQRFHQVIIDQLPPPFSLESPDTSWDAVEPALILKREILSLFIFTTKACLYRAFMDPCKSLHKDQNVGSKHGPDLLALSHRRALMDTTCKILACVAKLYVLTGGDEGGAVIRLFMLPITLVNALASLGICLLSIQADERRLLTEGIHTVTDPDLQYSYNTFFDAFNLLYREAPHYVSTKRGVEVLEGLHGTLRACLSGPDLFEASPTNTAIMGAFSSGQTRAGYFQLEEALVSLHANGGGEFQSRTFCALPEWLPSFLESPTRTWMFGDQVVFGDVLA